MWCFSVVRTHYLYNFSILPIWEHTDNTFRQKNMPYKNVVFQQNLNIGEKLPFSQTVMMISTVINIAHLEKVFIFSFLTLCYNTLALNYRKVSDSAVRVFVIQRQIWHLSVFWSMQSVSQYFIAFFWKVIRSVSCHTYLFVYLLPLFNFTQLWWDSGNVKRVDKLHKRGRLSRYVNTIAPL